MKFRQEKNNFSFYSGLIIRTLVVVSIIITAVLGFYQPSSTFVAAGFVLTLFFVFLSIGNYVKSENNKSLMAGIFTHGTQGILLCDHTGKTVLINPFFETLFGYTKKELEMRSPDEVIKGLNRDFYFPENQMPGVLDSTGTKKDGTQFPVELSVNTYRSGNKKYMVVFVTDSSVRKNNEEALVNRKIELEKV